MLSQDFLFFEIDSYNYLMTAYYILDIVVGFLFITGGFLLLPKIVARDNYRKTNTLFCILISAFYFFTVMVSLIKINRNNLKMVTPLSNVSPLLFTMTFICIFLKEDHRKALYKFMCLFNFVMFVAGFLSPAYGLASNAYYFKFVIFDELAHLSFGLFTFYLIVTEQVEIKIKDLILSIVWMATFVTSMFVINITTGTSFFGLCLNEQYNIYGQQLFSNCHVSNILYCVMLVLTMGVGYVFTRLIKSKSNF